MLCIVQVDAPATGRSLVQGSPTKCVCMCVCHCVLSCATVTLYAYSEEAEEVRLKKLNPVVDNHSVKLSGVFYLFRFQKYVVLPKVTDVNRFEPNLILYIPYIIRIISYTHHQMHTMRYISYTSLRNLVVQSTTKVYVLLLILHCTCNSLRMAPRCRNMQEFSKTCVWFISYFVHLLLNITDLNRLIRNHCFGFTVKRSFV
jgi:hypothetical protein